MILHNLWGPAVISLAVAGASDWLDGYLARRLGQGSVLGSYLDPLADKVLICSTVAALGFEVSHAWLAFVALRLSWQQHVSSFDTERSTDAGGSSQNSCI